VLRPPLESTQYANNVFSDRPARLGLRASMGSRGDAFDRAVNRPWHATLQTEQLDRQHLRTCDQFPAAILHIIEIYFSRHRLQSSLGYLSPQEFGRRYAQQAAVTS
jgi:putative transposase